MQQEKKLVNITELAKAIGVKESWLRRQVFLKAIPHYKVHGLIRFDLIEIYSWIEGSHLPTYTIGGDVAVSNE